MKHLSCPLLLIVLVLTNTYAQTKTPITAGDLMKIATTSQIQISPDGNRAVVVVNRKALKNENDYYYTRHLYFLDLAGKEEPRQLTFGDRNDGAPQWSPDGKQIAFVRTDGEKSQVWLMPLGGGEPRAITKAEFGAANPRFSPDGKKILFTSSIPDYAMDGQLPWRYERPGRQPGDEPNWKKLKPEERKTIKASPDGSLEEVRTWLSRNTLDNNPRVLTRQQLQGELNLQPEMDFTHLFVQTLGSDEKPAQLTSGYQDFEGAEWSPDGKRIICHSRVYHVTPDDEQDTDLWIIEPETKTAKEFLTWPGYSLSNASFSPDGTQVLFYAEVLANRHATQTQLAVVSAAGGNPLALTASLDRDAGGSAWSADSKTIFFTAQTEGDIPLFSVPARGGSVSKIFGNDTGINDFDVAGDKIVYALTETRNPWEVYLHNAKDKSSRQLTRLNEEWISKKIISVPKEYWHTRPDGMKIQYWVMEPVGRQEGSDTPPYSIFMAGHPPCGGPASSVCGTNTRSRTVGAMG